jgi:hypothetical protein
MCCGKRREALKQEKKPAKQPNAFFSLWKRRRANLKELKKKL